MCLFDGFNEENIRKIFGHEAAEDESIDRLKEYYLKTDAYNILKSNIPFYLLVGHKGIGKSALLKVLEMEDIQSNNIAITIRPDDIVGIGNHENNFLNRISVWKKGLTNIIMDKMYSFLKSHYMKKIGAPEILINMIGGFLKDKFDEFSIITENFSKVLMDDFLKNRKICIYIDDLDRGWKNTSEDIENLSALLNAIRDLNRTFASIKFRIGLRSDVYYSVRTSDETTDKIDGSVIWLRWTNHEIFVMLIKRINTFFKKEKNENILLSMNQKKLDVYLNELFEDTFKGVGLWSEVGMHKVLMSMIRRRPRDLVKLCTLAARKAAERGHKKIMTNDLKEIFSQYSQDRLLDTCNEYSSELKNIRELLLSMKPTRNEIEKGKPCIFKRAELIKKIQNIQQNIRIIFTGQSFIADAQDVAAFLYKINFLTARKDTKDNIQRLYYDENRYIYNEFSDFGYDFEIHPAYRWALQPDTLDDLFKSIQISIDSE